MRRYRNYNQRPEETQWGLTNAESVLQRHLSIVNSRPDLERTVGTRVTLVSAVIHNRRL